MPLTFPTQAEQCLADWQADPVTYKSLAGLALKRGAMKEQKWGAKHYIFDDDTSLIVIGTGKEHKVTCELP